MVFPSGLLSGREFYNRFCFSSGFMPAAATATSISATATPDGVPVPRLGAVAPAVPTCSLACRPDLLSHLNILGNR